MFSFFKSFDAVCRSLEHFQPWENAPENRRRISPMFTASSYKNARLELCTVIDPGERGVGGQQRLDPMRLQRQKQHRMVLPLALCGVQRLRLL